MIRGLRAALVGDTNGDGSASSPAAKDWGGIYFDEDAQAEGEGYVLDLYDAQPPVSMELQVEGDGALLLAALELKYDEELDGYYPGEKIRDAALLGQLLKRYIGQ